MDEFDDIPETETVSTTQEPIEPEGASAPDTFPETLDPSAFSQNDFPETLDASAFSKGPDFPDVISPTDFDASPNTSTTSGAFGRGAVEGALPAATGIGAGALIGTAVAPGIGTVAGALVGAAAGLGAGWLTSLGQDKVLDLMGLRGGEGTFSRAQQQTDEAQHPYAKFAGEMAPAAAALRPGGTLLQRGLGAGIGGGVTAGAEYLQHGEIDPIKVAMGAGFGAALPNLNRPTENLLGLGGGPAASPRAPGGNLPGGGPQRPGGPGHPIDGEIIPPEQRSLPYENNGRWARDIESAHEQRNAFEQNDPMWKFWDDYIRDLQSRDDNKGWTDVDASLGPRSDENPFTYRDGDRANDVTTTAAGVATENGPAPRVEGAGNPVGAPMQSRTAQRPTGLLRDYRKEAPATRGEVATQESTRVSEAPVHEDVLAALKTEPDAVSPVEAVAPQGEAHGNLPAPTPPPAPPAAHPAQPPSAPRPRAPGADVTATVTPTEQRVLASAKQALTEANMPQVLERLNALPPKEAAVAATKLLAALQSKTGTATAPGSAGEVRMPGKRPELPTGVTARSKADLARKQGVLDAYKKAVAEFTPTAREAAEAGHLDLSRLAKMVQRADELSGGNKYRPNEKPPEWQIINEARRVLKRPTPGQMMEFKGRETALRAGGKDTAKDFQQTNRIDADIENKPQIEEGAAEALTQREPEQQRPEHEPFNNERGEESAVYTEQHNRLTNWLNNLSDASHAQLMKEHPDLALDVKTTQDPHELMNNYMDDLTRLQKEAASFEAVPAENAPTTKRTPIKSRDDLAPTEPGRPASKGRVLDRNSPEFKAAAEAALKGTKTPAKYSLEHEQAKQRPGAEHNERALDGTSDKSFAQAMKEFLADESGAIPHAVVQSVSDWIRDKTRGFFHPRADQHILDYGAQIGVNGVKLRTNIARAKAETLANARASVEDHLSPLEKGRIFRAAELGKTDQLPPNLKAHWDTYWKPMLEKVERAYDELREITVRNGFPGHEAMVERVTDPAGNKWFPRRILTDKHAEDGFEPITNKSSLSNWAASAQERDWFVLHSKDTGDRKLYRVNEDGNMVFYKNHKAGSAKTPPSGMNPRQVGDTLTVGNQKMAVSHALIDEIMQHGNGEGGKPLKYSDNPGYVLSDAYVGLKSALYRAKLLDAILHDPDFAAMSARKKSVADERFGKGNWAESILPQLHDRYFPKPVAWAFDDLVKTGFNYNDNRFAEGASRFAQATLKPFYFLGPEVHVFNELDKYIVGMGLAHANVPREAKAFARALQSVRAQDGIQAEIMDAGGNPMFMHALTSRIMPQIAKIVGEDAARQKWKYEPLFKKFGVSLSEMSSQLYQDSNKMMWWQSDVLYTAAYLQFREQLAGKQWEANAHMLERMEKTVADPIERRRDPAKVAHLEKQIESIRAWQKGISEKAVHATEKVIDSYVVPTTMGKSVGLEGSDAGRFLQKFLTDPLTGLFGRFHYGLYHAAATIVKNLVGVNGMKGMAQGAAQAALMLGMYMAVYPLLSKGWQQVTGNPKSEFETRGLTRFVSTTAHVATGHKRDQDILRNLWTPSTIVQAGLEQISNRDWMGKEIADQPYTTVKGVVSNVSRRAEKAAQTLVSPYGTVARSLETPGVQNPDWAALRFLESNFGLKTPTPGAVKFETQQPKRDQQLLRQHRKRPGGMIERGGQRVMDLLE